MRATLRDLYTVSYYKLFGHLPPPASWDKLVQMDLKLKPEFVGHKIRSRPYPAPKEQADEIERQIQERIDGSLVLEYRDVTIPNTAAPVSWWLSLGQQPNGW